MSGEREEEEEEKEEEKEGEGEEVAMSKVKQVCGNGRLGRVGRGRGVVER